LLTRVLTVWLLAGCGFVVTNRAASAQSAAPLRSSPPAIELTQPEATQQVVVLRATEGRERDVTRLANLRVENPQVATVDREGLV